jgi:anti-anti-sigma factor
MALATIRRITERLRKIASAPVETSARPRVLPQTPQAELSGAFRLVDGPRLRAQLFGLLRQGARVIVLDCSRVSLMDGCGLAVLLEFIARCRAAGVRLKLFEPSRRLREAFAMYGLAGAIDALASHRLPELDSMLVVVEDDFEAEITLPAAA